MTASTSHAWTRIYEPNRNLITAVTNSFNGNLISAFDYVNDSIGRRTARFDALPGEVATTNAFSYNVRSEVASANMGTNTYGYVFDLIGNRITATNNAESASYIANGLNQYIAISNAISVLPVHDEDGNMIASGDGWNYVWNGQNCLILVSNETSLVSYAYDHQGRMVWKDISHRFADSQSWENMKSTSYIWDNFNIIAETSEENETTNTTYNVWGLEIDGTIQGAGGVGGLLAVVKDNAMSYFPCYDGNGNITEYVSAEGAIAAHREYDPFGGTVIPTGNADSFSHWFSTKPWCSVTGLSEYQYRNYCPVLGRWLNRDPIGESGGLMLYAFANNHYGSSDLLGLCECGDMKTKVLDRGIKRTCYDNWRIAYSDMRLIGPPVGAATLAISTLMGWGIPLNVARGLTLGTLACDIQPFVRSATIQAQKTEYRIGICQDYECVYGKLWNKWESTGVTYWCKTAQKSESYTVTRSDIMWCLITLWGAVPTGVCYGKELEEDYDTNPSPCEQHPELSTQDPHY